jgi:N,N'-diacetyllegionaminate synthase
MNKRTLVIAEAGVNHNGDIDLAFKLVDAAARAGADLVKFQTFRAQSLVTPDARKAVYQERRTGAEESQLDMLRRLELDDNAHRQLKAHCQACGIGFLSTGFDSESVDFLLELGVNWLKIPSGEITNLPYLRHIGRAGKQVILSTGMADMDETEQAIVALEAAGTSRSAITVLHCTTEYPAPMASVNLRAMLTLRDVLGVRVGYSDHTRGIEVAVAAVALGACVFEKHFTLDRGLPGPDHQASLEPDELAAMVSSIRNIEVALGDGVKQASEVELSNRDVVRKSLVALRPIQCGENFSFENVTAKRPGTGLSPMRWDEIMGRKAPRDFVVDEMIEL